jgi:hypothetical protein
LQIPEFAIGSSAKYAIGLRSQEKIRLRETVDLVRPDFDRAPPPRDVQVGVMTLLLGDVPHPIRERHRRSEVAKLERPQQVTGRIHRPTRLDLRQQALDSLSRQRRYATTARNALSVSQIHCSNLRETPAAIMPRHPAGLQTA